MANKLKYALDGAQRGKFPMLGFNNLTLCRAFWWAVGLGAGIVAGYVASSYIFWMAAVLFGIAVALFVAFVGSFLLCWGDHSDERALREAGEKGKAPAETPAAPKQASVSKPKPAPVASKPAPAPKPAAAAPADTASSGEAAKPAGLSGPRDGGADDLKQIKGVGPKLEGLLHSMGFYHFDQIAAWSPSEVAWVDENLQGFKGRVSRDNWIDQAKVLASGGETEFSKRVEGGDVY